MVGPAPVRPLTARPAAEHAVKKKSKKLSAKQKEVPVFKAPLPVEENDEDNETKLKGTTEAADPAAPLVKLRPEQVYNS